MIIAIPTITKRTQKFFAFSTNHPAVKSFYRRQMPEILISLGSPEGRQIFKEGMMEGNCESFFTWVQQFLTQNDVSTCATASMAMMLNALKVDPGSNWKGIWRWYDDYNIKHVPPDRIKEGLTLQEFCYYARMNGTHSMGFSPLEGTVPNEVQSIRKSSLDLFRNSLIASSQQSDFLLTVNFFRKTLGQTGTGHYSPVGGFNAQRNLVLILDVAKFKYDSYWCPLQTLYQALKPIDLTSKLSRGYILATQKVPLGISTQGISTEVLSSASNSKSWIFSHIVQLLNNIQNHHLLIYFLFTFATMETPPFSLTNVIANTLQISEEDIRLVREKLNEEAKILLSAFKRNSIQEILLVLCATAALAGPTKAQLSKVYRREHLEQLLVLLSKQTVEGRPELVS